MNRSNKQFVESVLRAFKKDYISFDDAVDYLSNKQFGKEFWIGMSLGGIIVKIIYIIIH